MESTMNTNDFAAAPDVTVGIPFYGRVPPDQLRQAIESILQQTYRPAQVHLIQDGPVPEPLADVAAEFVRTCPQVKHLPIARQSGLAYALNLSILNSATRYYARMDADDIAHPQRLEKQVAYLQAHPEVDILGTWVKEFQQDPRSETGFVKVLPHDPQAIEELFHYRNPLAHPTVIFRRAVFARIGLYDHAFTTECDLELWGRALHAGVRIDNLQEPLLYFRMVGVVRRRSGWGQIGQQLRARYRHNTWSPRLNAMKLAAVGFRLLPQGMQRWGYRNLRG